MNRKTFNTVFRKLTVSQIAACVCAFIANTVDTGISGRFLGGDALAAISYALPVILFYVALATLISYGAQLQCSKFVGAGDTEWANAQFTVTLFMMLFLSFLLLALLSVFPRSIASMLGADSEYMIEMTADYLVGLSYGIPPIFIMVFFTQICNIEGNATLPIISVLVLIVSDVCFDLLNAVVIKGGIYGMGVASSMSYVLAALVILLHLFYKKRSFRFRVRGIEGSMITKPLICGIPSSVMSIGLACLSLLINYILTDSGNFNAVSAFGAGYCIIEIVLSIPNGLAPGVLTFAGVFYGEEDRKSLIILLKEMLRVSIIWNLAAFVLLVIVTKPVVSLFTDDAEIARICSTAVPLMASQLVFYSIDTCFENYLLAIGKEKLIIVLSALSNFVLCAVCALAFNGLFGTNGVWLCYTGGKILAVIALAVLVTVKNGSFPKCAADWLMLPKGFAESRLAEASFAVRNQEEAIAASRGVWDFCTGHNADSRTRFVLSLFAEEIGNNAVQHGFSGGKGERQLDVNVICGIDYWRVRLRDNGILFDPLKYLKLYDDENPEHNIGIKMAVKMADDIKYQNTFSLNNIILTVKKKEA